MDTHKDTFFLLLSQQLQLLFVWPHKFSPLCSCPQAIVSVTAEDKQVETGFFGLFPETYCKLSIFDLHLSNQPKEHKRF